MNRMVVAVLVAGWTASVVLAQDPAPGQDVDALQKQRAEIEQQRNELQTKWNRRVSELAKAEAVAKADALAAEAEAKYSNFIRADPKLEDLRKGVQTANNALQSAIEIAAAADKEGAANRKAREALVKSGYQQEYEIGLIDFEYNNKVKRQLGDDPAVVAARQAVWAAEQAVRDLEYNDAEIGNLRNRLEQARRNAARAKEGAMTDAYRSAWKTLQEANQSVADATVALTSAKALDVAKSTAGKVYNDKMAGDSEGNALRAERARLLKERAELDYQISMVDYKLQNGVSRRLSRDPDVARANGEVYAAEREFRRESDADVKLAAARKAQQESQKAFHEQEQALGTVSAVAQSSKAVEAAEVALSDARKMKTQKAQEALVEARRKETEVMAAALNVHPAAKALTEKRSETSAARDADLSRIRELDLTYSKVRDRVSKESPDVAKVKQTLSDANEAYNKGVKESDAPALEKARNEARGAARKVLDDAIAADDACKALKPQIDAMNAKLRGVDREVRKAEAVKAKSTTSGDGRAKP